MVKTPRLSRSLNVGRSARVGEDAVRLETNPCAARASDRVDAYGEDRERRRAALQAGRRADSLQPSHNESEIKAVGVNQQALKDVRVATKVRPGRPSGVCSSAGGRRAPDRRVSVPNARRPREQRGKALIALARIAPEAALQRRIAFEHVPFTRSVVCLTSLPWGRKSNTDTMTASGVSSSCQDQSGDRWEMVE